MGKYRKMYVARGSSYRIYIYHGLFCKMYVCPKGTFRKMLVCSQAHCIKYFFLYRKIPQSLCLHIHAFHRFFSLYMHYVELLFICRLISQNFYLHVGLFCRIILLTNQNFSLEGLFCRILLLKNQNISLDILFILVESCL